MKKSPFSKRIHLLPVIAGMASLLFMSGLFSSCKEREWKGADGDQTPIEASADSGAGAPWSLIPVELSEGKWCFVDPAGEVILAREFDETPSIPYNGFFTVGNDYGLYDVWRISGNGYSFVPFLKGAADVGYMEGGLIPVVFPGERISVYTDGGVRRFTAMPVDDMEVSSVKSCFSDGLLAFRVENGKLGFFDEAGHVAILPMYDEVSLFSNGLAVVGVKDDEQVDYSVIDRNGDYIFGLQEGDYPDLVNGRGFSNGYLVARNDSVSLIYDEKGRRMEFPATLGMADLTDGRYIIFHTPDYLYGTADMAGNIVIEPKYLYLSFNGENGPFGGGNSSRGFFANADFDSLILNADGTVRQRLDCAEMLPFGRFGYFAYSDGSFYLMGADGRLKCPVNFRGLNIESLSPFDLIESLYF